MQNEVVIYMAETGGVGGNMDDKKIEQGVDSGQVKAGKEQGGRPGNSFEKQNPPRMGEPERNKDRDDALGRIFSVGQKLREFDALSDDEKAKVKAERQGLTQEQWEKLPDEKKEKMTTSETWEKLSGIKIEYEGREISANEAIAKSVKELENFTTTGKISEDGFKFSMQLVNHAEAMDALKGAMGDGDDKKGAEDIKMFKVLTEKAKTAGSDKQFSKEELVEMLGRERAETLVRELNLYQESDKQARGETAGGASVPAPLSGDEGHVRYEDLSKEEKDKLEKEKKKGGIGDSGFWYNLERVEYATPTLAMILMIQYLKSVAEFAAFIEVNAERTRRGTA